MIDPHIYALKDGGISLADLCATLGIDAPEGSFSDVVITAPASLETAQPGEITFLANRKSAEALETSKATACFVTEKFAPLVGDKHIIPVITSTPKYHLCEATRLLVREREDGARIDPSASIHPSAVIGPGVIIGPRVSVGPNCVITHAVLGEGTTVKANSVIGGEGFGVVASPSGDIASVPHVGRVVIGERVLIGSNACIDRGQLGDTVIGDDCKIDNLVQIAHNCVLGRGCVLAGHVGLSGSCVIGDGVMMGGRVGLADHVNVGDGARLAAFAGVMHDVPAGATWSGIPAMPIRDHMKLVAQDRRAVRK